MNRILRFLLAWAMLLWAVHAPAADIKKADGAVVTHTITLTSLASSATAGRESTAVSNATDKFLSYECFFQSKLGTGTPANDKAVYVYLARSLDEATPVYPDAVTGTDAAITLNDPTQLELVAAVPATVTDQILKKAFDIPSAPKRLSFVVRNYSGVALSAVAGDHLLKCKGVYYTSN